MTEAPTRILGPGLYGLDRLRIGDRIETGRCDVTAERIDAFAALTGDRFEIHMDDAAARRHGFAARVAHGLLVLSLVDGLKNQARARFDAIASLGWEWQFRAPVLAGDRIGVSGATVPSGALIRPVPAFVPPKKKVIGDGLPVSGSVATSPRAIHFD